MHDFAFFEGMLKISFRRDCDLKSVASADLLHPYAHWRSRREICFVFHFRRKVRAHKSSTPSLDVLDMAVRRRHAKKSRISRVHRAHRSRPYAQPTYRVFPKFAYDLFQQFISSGTCYLFLRRFSDAQE